MYNKAYTHYLKWSCLELFDPLSIWSIKWLIPVTGGRDSLRNRLTLAVQYAGLTTPAITPHYNIALNKYRKYIALHVRY